MCPRECGQPRELGCWASASRRPLSTPNLSLAGSPDGPVSRAAAAVYGLFTLPNKGLAGYGVPGVYLSSSSRSDPPDTVMASTWPTPWAYHLYSRMSGSTGVKFLVISRPV